MNSKSLLLVIVALFVLSVSSVQALQISVDGDPSDWVSAASVATSPPIPSNPLPGSDIAEVFFTNDQNNFYWRIDTYDNPDWSANDGHSIQICMNTDNDTSTGAASLNGCNVSPTEDFGFDYMIIIRAVGEQSPTIETYICPDCFTSGSPGIVASSGNVTEIGVPIADLQINDCTSGADCVIPTTIYSSALNPAYSDWVPNPNETFNVAVPGPTAVSLNTFSAGSNSGSQLNILVILGLAALCLYVYVHRNQKR